MEFGIRVVFLKTEGVGVVRELLAWYVQDLGILLARIASYTHNAATTPASLPKKMAVETLKAGSWSGK